MKIFKHKTQHKSKLLEFLLPGIFWAERTFSRFCFRKAVNVDSQPLFIAGSWKNCCRTFLLGSAELLTRGEKGGSLNFLRKFLKRLFVPTKGCWKVSNAAKVFETCATDIVTYYFDNECNLALRTEHIFFSVYETDNFIFCIFRIPVHGFIVSFVCVNLK